MASRLAKGVATTEKAPFKAQAQGMRLLASAVPVWQRTHEEVETLLPEGDPDRLRKNLRALS